MSFQTIEYFIGQMRDSIKHLNSFQFRVLRSNNKISEVASG